MNQFARRHVSGSPQVAPGAVRCPIAFEWRDVWGKRHPEAVGHHCRNTLLNLFSDADQYNRDQIMVANQRLSRPYFKLPTAG
jgi:hypothetical protein